MEDGFTASILSGDLPAIEYYLATQDIDIAALDEYGFTPLIEATIAGQLEVMRRLLSRGALVDQKDVTGRTALHWAVDNANFPICELLLQHEADPNAYSNAGQPLLVLPYLRRQKALKKLLCQKGASLSFAQDFVRVKLLGHRYELVGQADIIDPQGRFVAIYYEGFFLEFVIEIIAYSLAQYCHHFMARAFQTALPLVKLVIQLFERAARLLQYQKYTVDIQMLEEKVDSLLDTNLLFLPIAYEGHAISLIQYRDILIRCDRGENGLKEGGIVVYRMKKPYRWTKAFIKDLFYKKQSEVFITQSIPAILGLERVANINIDAQIVGNCSWANMEASVLALLHMLEWKKSVTSGTLTGFNEALHSRKVYEHWLSWDKSQALEDCLQSFKYEKAAARKATIATLLGAILFQRYRYQHDEDVIAARRLIPILMDTRYQYVLKSYLKVYWYDKKTEEGHNLAQLLNACGVTLSV